MKHLIAVILLFLPGLLLAQTPLKSGGNTKLIPGPGSRVSRQEVTNGIVGWWKLNEGTGTSAADSSGNGNTGTLTSGPIWTNALYGGLLALSLDGVDDCVTTTAASVTATPLTLCAWIKTTSSTAGAAIFSITDSTQANWMAFYLGIASGKLSAIVANNNVFGVAENAATFNDGKWHHAVGVFTSSTSRTIFVDGVSLASDATNITPTGINTTTIGCSQLTTRVAFFPGSIDDVRIYNRALTLAEIQLLFTNGPNNTP